MGESELSARVRLLEERHRRAQLSQGILAVVAGIVVLWLAVRTPKAVTAERVVLRDAGGQVRGAWAPSTRIVAEENGKDLEASITCLTMRSVGRSRALLCAPWEEPSEPTPTLGHST